MQIDKKLLLKCIALPLLVGLVSSLLTGNSMQMFGMLNKPPFSPPGWLFPVVWTILYVLMGNSSYLVLTSGKDQQSVEKSILIYRYQLIVNFLWSTFFFSFEWYLFSFLWLILLWVLIFLMIRSFWSVSKVAALLQIPYLLWVTFAGYLNLGIWLLN